jgi:hypothetical protein
LTFFLPSLMKLPVLGAYNFSLIRLPFKLLNQKFLQEYLIQLSETLINFFFFLIIIFIWLSLSPMMKCNQLRTEKYFNHWSLHIQRHVNSLIMYKVHKGLLPAAILQKNKFARRITDIVVTWIAFIISFKTQNPIQQPGTGDPQLLNSERPAYIAA